MGLSMDYQKLHQGGKEYIVGQEIELNGIKGRIEAKWVNQTIMAVISFEEFLKQAGGNP